LILLFSLAIYSRKYTGWHSTGEFDIDVTHTAFGVPHWLILNQLDVDGTPPPIDPRYLPEAERYQAGWHVRPLYLFASLALCIILAIPLSFSYRRARPDRGFWAYAIALIPAAIAGTVAFTEPRWVGVTLGLVVLPLCMMAMAAVFRNYLHSAIAGVGMVAVLWWTQRMVDVFRTEHLVHGLPDENDLPVLIFFVPAVLIVAFASTAVSRFVASGGRITSRRS